MIPPMFVSVVSAAALHPHGDSPGPRTCWTGCMTISIYFNLDQRFVHAAGRHPTAQEGLRPSPPRGDNHVTHLIREIRLVHQDGIPRGLVHVCDVGPIYLDLRRSRHGTSSARTTVAPTYGRPYHSGPQSLRYDIHVVY